MIEENHNEQDSRSILFINISWQGQKDELIWAFTKDGNYSVKSAYMLGKRGNFDSFHQAWVEIRRMETTPRLDLSLETL